MELLPEEVEERMRQLREGLRRSGVKTTHQRMEIFREVAKSGDHPDAETVYRGVRGRMPTVSLDTVYRTLWLLLDLGLISTLGSPRERVRFDANIRPHHHFVCVRCGITRDIHSTQFDRLKIPESVKAFGEVGRAQVEVRGTCLECLKEATQNNALGRKKERRNGQKEAY